jgi:hypothetical protein
MADARRYGGRILAYGQLYSTTPADGQIIPSLRCGKILNI